MPMKSSVIWVLILTNNYQNKSVLFSLLLYGIVGLYFIYVDIELRVVSIVYTSEKSSARIHHFDFDLKEIIMI